ncbi:DUF3604 domain-containing protein [Porticoccaceae bacterium]|nr:DUF3604 domain-containing protein [Porticoccaceae bacterium]MDB2621288.1 DUF3604 domain-containing protein [Porticoccaceae bacterium]MDC0523722.1 DUF3604 domain-containing protein [Porticoccaceae bacterium]
MITRHATYRQSALVLLMGLGLTACSGDKMGSSNEAFSTAADVHDNEDVIVATREIDELLQQRGGAILGGQKPLFDVETELLQGKGGPWSESKDEQALDQARNAYFGDLHVHTTYSFDGYAFGTLATPYDAYRFARGEAIKNPAGYEMQLTRPMDFYAVTDHGMFLGVVQAAADTSTDFSKNPFSEPYHDLNAPDNFGTGFFSRMKRLLTFSGFIPQIISGISGGSIDRGEVLNVVRTAWEDTIVAADQFNSPGEFTTFAAYEYTTSSVGMGNLHRNVIFDGTESLPREPFSRFHSSNPEDLWDWMDELRAKGVESLAIPHNSNGSNGLMFQTNDFAGNAFDKAYVEQRSRNEPIVEITQIKGTSETHPTLSSRDEWAGFEIMPYRVATAALSQLEGSYVREALLNGLAIEKQGVGNPYGFGFIGSSDTHSAASQNDESNFVSKLGILSSTAEQRGSVPFKGIDGQFAYYASYLATRLYPTPLGKNMYVKIDGDVYTSGSTPTFGAAGLAAAWAEENTRESLYSAFRRKEVFATSGPRIRLRFFAGYDFNEAMLSAPDGVEQAYAKGVTMGGSLVGNGMESPGFLVMASADPENAPLQRLQIIKGWIDDDGATHEEVIDVACANGAEVNPDTNRCSDNGARVDASNCAINPETGSDQLSTLWYDPNFKSDQRAFYYARVLENPTCRWSTWDAIRAGVAPRPDFAKTVQERAWSSPIHYLKD